MAPIIASTLATLRAAKTYGSEVGIRTRRKTAGLPAAYDRISSICCGLHRRQAAQRVDEHREEAEDGRDRRSSSPGRCPNQAFAIGAKAMIGIAFAAMKYGISAAPTPAEAREHERGDDREPGADHEAPERLL